MLSLWGVEAELPGTLEPNLRAVGAVTCEFGDDERPRASVVNLIAATTTRTGLRVRSALDTTEYPAGQKVGDAEMAKLHHRPDAFHGEWNYSLLPRERLPLTE